MNSKAEDIDAQVKEILANFPQVTLALLFGSVASGRARPESDLDLAVLAGHPLDVDEKSAMISALAERIGRPVDLVDLFPAPEPLLGQVLRHGRRIFGSNAAYSSLVSRHLIEEADFMPIRRRLLAERRAAWIGK